MNQNNTNILTLKYFFLFGALMLKTFLSGSVVASLILYTFLLVLLFNNLSAFGQLFKAKQNLFLSNADIIILLSSISFLRAYLNDTLSLSDALYYLISISLMAFMIRFDCMKKEFWRAIYSAIAIILIINFLLFCFGINESVWINLGLNNYQRLPQKLRIVETLNFNFYRSGFFIFNNFAYYSMLIGFLLIGIKTGIYNPKMIQKISLLFMGFMTIIILDARGPALFLFITFLFSKLITKLQTWHFRIIFLALLGSPVIYLVLFVLTGMNPENFNDISSSRGVLWGSFVLNYQPNIYNFLFGYGFLGQKISGISQAYEYLFSDRGTAASIISLHNTYLQYLLDLGFSGIIMFYLVIKRTFMKIEKLNLVQFKPALIFFLAIGTLEMGTIPNNLIVYILLISIIYFVDWNYLKFKINN